MRPARFFVISCILGTAAGGADCNSKSLPISSRDAAISDSVGGAGPDAESDAGSTDYDAVAPGSGDGVEPGTGPAFVLPDGAIYPSLAACIAPVDASCPALGVRYYFNQDQGDCVQTQGCEGTGNTFASMAECEIACLRSLYCSCSALGGACNNQALACDTCPTPSMLANQVDTVSGKICLNPGLNCHLTTADQLMWECRCRTSVETKWSCEIYMGP